MSEKRHGQQSPISEELGGYLKVWRERLDPTRIPGIDTSRRRLKPGLTQEEVAGLTSVSVTWYRALERGDPRQFSEQFLQRLAMTLRLDEAERVMLFRLAIGHTPEPVHLAPDLAAGTEMQIILDKLLPHPAYLSNLQWDIIRMNQPQEDWFPWIPYEPNLMRWALIYPEAREQLVNWRDDWARPFIAQIRYALATHPDSEELMQLRNDVIAGSEEVRELWGEKESQAHPHGDVRRLRLPHHGGEEVQVKIMAFSPLSNPDARFIVLLRV